MNGKVVIADSIQVGFVQSAIQMLEALYSENRLRRPSLTLAWVKAQARAKVEHLFRVIKRQFGHVKNRCRGLVKNTAPLTTLFALSNVWRVRKN